MVFKQTMDSVLGTGVFNADGESHILNGGPLLTLSRRRNVEVGNMLICFTITAHAFSLGSIVR